MTRVAVLAVLTVLAVSGCAAGANSPASEPGSGNVTVFAAASLTEAFTAIGRGFEAAHPNTRVTFSFAGSSALATQINQGAPADVFAAAAPANMKTVSDAGGLDGSARVFVRNQLVIAVAKGNPKHIKGLSDLTSPDVKVALCAEQVPCGAAARTALGAANVSLTPVTFEQDVKAALSKVKLGEVDAALVYRTDARSASSDVDGVEFAESARAVNDYPIGLLARAANKPAGQAFIDYVVSDPGIAVLTNLGFQKA